MMKEEVEMNLKKLLSEMTELKIRVTLNSITPSAVNEVTEDSDSQDNNIVTMTQPGQPLGQFQLQAQSQPSLA